LNPTLVAILVVALLGFGLALAKALRAEPTTRLILLVTLGLAALLILPWAASTPERLTHLALALVIALGLGFVAWAAARWRRAGSSARLSGRQDGSEPRQDGGSKWTLR
jgi:drug/metabolite transporter (DMT)-like permease